MQYGKVVGGRVVIRHFGRLRAKCGTLMVMDFSGGVGYVIHELAQHITAESDKVLAERHNLTFAQYKVLLATLESPGAQQKEIALLLRQTEASISRQVGILIDKDLILIGAAEDNRKHPIYLTIEGEDRTQSATMTLNQLQGRLFSVLSDHELANLVVVLSKLKTAI